MENIALSTLLNLVLGFFCLSFSLLLFFASKKNRLLQQRLTHISGTLLETTKKLEECIGRNEAGNGFEDNLEVAGLTTRLQKPRLEAQSGSSSSLVAGKYGSVQSLAAQGRTSEEIAATLAISVHEADQLVNLSRLVQPSG